MIPSWECKTICRYEALNDRERDTDNWLLITVFSSIVHSKPDLAENAKQGLNKLLANEVPIEIKPVNPPQFYRRGATEPKKLFWVRARGYIGKMH